MSATSDPYEARRHTRSMAGIKVEAMPILPPWNDDSIPDGVDPSAVLWRETISGGGYTSKSLARGARLLLEDLKGEASISMLLFNAAASHERLSVADTLKVQWTAYLGAGNLLLSDMGRVFMSILECNAPSPDALCGASSLVSNVERFGDGFNHGMHPNSRDRFRLAVAKNGLGNSDIHPCINWFKKIVVGTNGCIEIDIGPFAPGNRVLLRAEMDLIIVLANCPHVLDPRREYHVSPGRITAWRGPITGSEDPIRNSTIEAQRAFLNVDDYYRR
jgi:uncharacterized protein